jgi:hypothetical protein
MNAEESFTISHPTSYVIDDDDDEEEEEEKEVVVVVEEVVGGLGHSIITVVSCPTREQRQQQ